MGLDAAFIGAILPCILSLRKRGGAVGNTSGARCCLERLVVQRMLTHKAKGRRRDNQWVMVEHGVIVMPLCELLRWYGASKGNGQFKGQFSITDKAFFTAATGKKRCTVI
jgi:hypothetical protein